MAIEECGILGEEQNGFRKDRRGEDNIYVIRELIDIYRKRDKKLILAFLDIEKAYDKINRKTLRTVIEKLGIPTKICNLIMGMYRNTKAKFIFGDIVTDWVFLKKGVRQGCVLSPLLFSMYTEELAKRISKENLGVGIGNDKLGMLLYADDVVLIADELPMMQKMLDIANDYSREFSLNFSAKKCGVMVVNGAQDEGQELKLGSETLERVSKYNYLGVMFDEKGIESAKQNRIYRGNQWWGRLSSIAKFRANKYEILRGIWKNIAVPGLTYAMDTVNWTGGEVKQMDIVQNKIGRLALGARSYTAVEALRGEMGWSTFEERLMKGKLRFKVRLEEMDGARWAKKVYLEAGRLSRWLKDCSDSARKGGFFKTWNLNERGEMQWNLAYTRGDTTRYDMKQWRVYINTRVQEFGLGKWRRGIESKSSLIRYAKKKCPRKEVFYDGSWGSSLLFKARSGSLELNDRTYRFNDSRTKNCEHGCLREGRVIDETLHHVMVECEGYPEAMEWAVGVYVDILGEQRFREVTEGSDDQGIDFFLGLEENVPLEVIEVTKMYLTLIWNERQRKIMRRQGTEGSLPESQFC